MTRLRAVTLAIAAVLLVVVAPAGARPKHHKPKGPSNGKVTKLLTDQYTQESKMYPSVRESYTVKKVVRGRTHVGKHRADGTPTGIKTYVFPRRVTGVYVKCYSDGSAVRQTIKGDYVFFKDEFHSWTFRIRSEDRNPQPGSDRIASCPL
jgi:hypothetical protein